MIFNYCPFCYLVLTNDNYPGDDYLFRCMNERCHHHFYIHFWILGNNTISISFRINGFEIYCCAPNFNNQYFTRITFPFSNQFDMFELGGIIPWDFQDMNNLTKQLETLIIFR